MLKISNVKYEIKHDTKKLSFDELNAYGTKYLFEKYKIKTSNVTIIKKSIDARKTPIFYVLTYIFEVENEDRLLKKYKEFSKYKRNENFDYLDNINKNDKKVVIIGMGPAGIFNAIVLNKAGYDVTIVEQGSKVEDRIKKVEDFINGKPLDEHTNIQFGEGGAGTFSDGKLGTNINSPYINFILETFTKYGANKDLLYEAKPHIGTDVLRKVLINIRKDLIVKGVKIYFNTKFVDYDNNKKKAMLLDLISNKSLNIEYDYLIIATGHSSTSVYELLKQKGVMMKPKPFAMGVRIEQLQKIISFSQYKGDYPFIEPADYKLVSHLGNGRSLYTFCMCPGGIVVNASSENGQLVCNGMSNYERDEINANSAVLVNVNVADYYKNDVLDGARFIKEYEKKAYDSVKNNHLPVQLFKDFKNNKTSTTLGNVVPSVLNGYEFVNLNDILPSFVSETLKLGLEDMNKKIVNFATDDVVLSALESRSSSPVQISRNEDLCTSLPNIYAIGEGSGYAGGITTSALDGIKIALKIIENDNKGVKYE